MTDLPKAYNPSIVEKKWSSYWLSTDYFQAKIDWGKKRFSIVIPPPNVTGSLHVGHALNNTLQDIVVRRKRMQGYVTLWLPGTDHAGIATQNVVESQLAQESLTRDSLGREKFIERVWQWKETYGNLIINQLKTLGCSCDWSRERFTMDEGCSRAVREAFVRLYNDGLIYRGNYIINWCPRCLTALSDIEVEHEEIEGKLWYVKYPLEDGSSFIVVATTRPETMLGDTAVAVNPNDERYRSYVGKIAILPLVGRKIPIIEDEYVDPNFGSGALKITPAHDLNDFEISQRHNLPALNIFTPDAKVNENGGNYCGLSREKAREAVLKDLKAQGLIEKIENYLLSLGKCYRCDTPIEPYYSLQWFVKTKPLALEAIKVVRDGRIKFTPKSWEKTYFDWMENIKDWCISRQIWWGHQIPVWYCQDCNKENVEVEKPVSCKFCGSLELVQESDVLDTWFSSALWPFSTLGWPEKTDDLKYFYPTDLLVTSHDIIFFWVARMVMMGLYLLKEIPFKEVYIHGLIRDIYGRKMSKSRGNVIDPLEIINTFGTDALRFTLAALSVPGREIYLSEERIEGYRNFCNKIWNASRFVLMNLKDFSPQFKPDPSTFTLSDRWILSRYAKTIKRVNQFLDVYRFSEAAKTLYNFFWDDFCDWYIELSKLSLYNGEEIERRKSQFLLTYILKNFLKLIHPFMPFISEEIWQKLPGCEGDIVVALYPEEEIIPMDEKSEESMEILKDLVTAVRSIRSQLNISPLRKIEILFKAPDKDKEALLRNYADYISFLTGASKIGVGIDVVKPSQSAISIEHGVEIFVPLADLVDIVEERERIGKEIFELKKELEKVRKKFSNKAFLEKAPTNIIQKEKNKLEKLKEKIEKLEQIHRLLE